MKLRVTTFNIQHGRDHNRPGDVIDLPLMAETAAQTGAALFGFNEVRRGQTPDCPDTPAVLGEMLGGEAAFGKAISIGRGRDYGNAVVSRCPILSCETVPIPDPDKSERGSCWETRCVIRARIDVGGIALTALVTHFGLSAAERNNAADTVIALAERADTPVVLMGDLNLERHDPVYARLCRTFVDAADALHNEENTFPSDRPEKRIDYVFLKNCTPLEIHAVRKIASDHFALTAEIELTR